jgi:hypothetical protein
MMNPGKVLHILSAYYVKNAADTNTRIGNYLFMGL